MQTQTLSSQPLPDSLVALLRKQAPEVFRDGKVDVAALRARLGEVSEQNEQYGISWAGKRDSFLAIQDVTSNTLKRDSKNGAQGSADSGNIFIEGDNLEVMKVLQRSYYGNVKMIYIDPPYNTGNDFVYNDSFAKTKKEEQLANGSIDAEGNVINSTLYKQNTKDSGHYHSDWLSMMYPRLFMARTLLRPDGVIFVSIDDNEVHNLRMIMNEIFGEENYLNTFCWINNLKGRQISGSGAAKTHEYVLVYARNIENMELFDMPVSELKELMPASYKGFNYETENDTNGDFVVKNELYNTNSLFNEETRKNLVFNIHFNFDTEEVRFSNVNEDVDFTDFVKISPKKNNNGTHKYHAWRWSKEKILNELKDLKFVKTNDGAKVFTKIRAYSITALKDIVTDISTTSGAKDIEDLFGGEKYFNYPKPVDLIKIFISQSNNNDLILDFFAGSGTTAHAVMQQNAEDGGNRKWICVQLPEKCKEGSEAAKAGYTTIADIARERIRRASAKIAAENEVKKSTKEKESGYIENLDTGFVSYKLAQSNFKIWNTHIESEEDLHAQLLDHVDSIVPGSTDAHLLDEILLKAGYPLTAARTHIKVAETGYVRIGENGELCVSVGDVTLELIDSMCADGTKKMVILDRGLYKEDKTEDAILFEAKKRAKEAGVEQFDVL